MDEERVTFKPWEHQLHTGEFVLSNDRVFDMSDPGTGKTSGHLLALATVLAEGYDLRTLIVCPKTLMRSAWGNEINQFFPEITFSLAEAGKRERAFDLNTNVVIINTDGVAELAKKPKLLKGFGRLIIDESTAFKHASSQRSKAMNKIARQFEHRALLTGTPNANSVTELWHPMMLLDNGERLGPSFFHFRNSVQAAKQVGPMPNHVKWEDKPEALEAVFSLISDVSIRHAFEDVMTHVPANHVARYSFELKPSLMKLYMDLEKRSILELGDGKINAVHASSLRQKLLQLASGAVYTGDDSYVVLDTQRYELVADLVDSYNHSVVFFNWKHQRDQLRDMLTKRGVPFAIIDGDQTQGREQIVADFQAGRLKTLLLHPRTGAHGLTLTRGEACILCSPIYEADYLKQAIHRIYRGAQDKVTNTVLVQAAYTVEGLVYERLDAKSKNMNDFLSLVVESQRRR